MTHPVRLFPSILRGAFARAASSLVLPCALLMVGSSLAQAQTFTVLHTFTGGGDGWGPFAGLTIDAAGNLYGSTTEFTVNAPGTVFEMKRHDGGWIFTTLSAPNGFGGRNPFGRPVIGPGGTLYGTTYYGGDGFCTELGCGTVYALRAPQTFCRGVSCPWTGTVDYSFNGPDGDQPASVEPVFDSAGNIYGTTTEGGSGVGNVFELTKSNGQWTETNLHVFSGLDGEYPQSSVTLDAQGNVYGTAYAGGGNGRGTVWELTNNGSGWTFAVLYDFSNPSDGNGPVGAPVFDAAGNLYLPTFSGGANGGGTVFELSPSGGGRNFSLIYSFTGSGYNPGPLDSLTMDAAGNLYGTTNLDGAHGCGSVFKLTRNDGNWSYSDLHDFTCGSDGANPFGGVALDGQGNLYGTTSAGGGGNCSGGCGVVWEITP